MSKGHRTFTFEDMLTATQEVILSHRPSKFCGGACGSRIDIET